MKQVKLVVLEILGGQGSKILTSLNTFETVETTETSGQFFSIIENSPISAE